jgi:RNA polymerase sigma-70 factor (ECF subfamily)
VPARTGCGGAAATSPAGESTGRHREHAGTVLSDDPGELFRAHWWPAVATLTRLLGDLEAGEDAVQDACALALTVWPREGTPANPKAWLIGVARHEAVDRIRRERLRAGKEAEAMRGLGREIPAGPRTSAAAVPGVTAPASALAEDQLGLIFACCHPALDPAVRVGLTLRCVCGLSTADIAAAFLVPEPTMAQRLVRAKRKIRQAGISLRMPEPPGLTERLDAVLRVVYLVFTQGHRAAAGPALVRGELCDQAIALSRALAALLPARQHGVSGPDCHP